MAYKFKDILTSFVLTQEACRVLLNGRHSFNSLNSNGELFDQFIAVQDELYKKANKKIPSMATAGCFFTREALEQSTSELLARWKSTLFRGAILFDLCGGLGADAFFMASGFRKVYSIDPDEELHDIFMHNARQMAMPGMERLAMDAAQFLDNTGHKADWIYLDPDRRMDGRRKTGFRHYTPEPESFYRQYASKGKNWLIKLSPLDDLQAVYRAFPSLKRIWVLSALGEVKELLVELRQDEPDQMNQELVAVELDDAGEAVRLETNLLPWPKAPVTGFGGKWLFEPSSGLIKSEILLRQNPVGWVSGNRRGTLWFADMMDMRYPGRWTEIELLLEDCSLKKAAKMLRASGVDSAVVKARELPINSEEARKALGLMESDVYRVYVSTTGKKRWLAAGKVFRF